MEVRTKKKEKDIENENRVHIIDPEIVEVPIPRALKGDSKYFIRDSSLGA